MSDPLQYTHGWICHPTELTAVIATLDERHEPLNTNAEHDGNSYSLGMAGANNVAIAVLPNVESDSASAVSVATAMRRIFPNIRDSLVVGIESDTPLGNISVNSPSGGEGGVLEYDLDKSIQTQKFSRTGSLEQPPSIRVVNKAQITFEDDSHKLIYDIKENPGERLRKERRRRRNEKERKEREEREDHERAAEELERRQRIIERINAQNEEISRRPAVPIRPIALKRSSSSNTYIPLFSGQEIGNIRRLKINERLDREQREREDDAQRRRLKERTMPRQGLLTREDGMPCLEMEAAGITNKTPVLVPRSIHDYVDPNKNETWQGDGTMPPAANAKDSTRQDPPNGMTTGKMRKTISKVHEDINERNEDMPGLEENIESFLTGVQSKSNDTTAFDETVRLREVKNWLSPPDNSTNFNITRVELQGLGTWFLKSTAFNEWRTGIRRHLWLHGIPGNGKTVLSTAILDNVSHIHDHIALDFFFDFSDVNKQRTDAMFRSLTFQLYIQRQAPRKILDELFASYDNGRKQAETVELSKCFHAMLQVSGKGHIVLDALDECVNTTELLDWIQGFVSSPHLHNFQLFATSRPGEELEQGIRRCIGEYNCISFDQSFLTEDVGAYISSRLEQSQMFQRWTSTPEILEKIRCEVERKADGMFKLAACQLDDLEQSLTLEELISRLDNLPRDLSAIYDRMILNIPPEFKSDAFCLLKFLVHAERPVTFIEAVDHVSTQAENNQVDDVQRRLLVNDNMSSYCPGLVSITEESRDGTITKKIQLGHITVMEYLMSRSEFQPAPTAVRVAFTESYGSSTVDSQLFSEEAVSTKPSSLEENINVTEDHATRQMAKTFYSHKQIESSCDDTSDDIRSLISGLEDIQSQDGSNSTRWEVREAAANYLADMLTKDPNLGPLYEEAFKSLDDARFVRNHGRLLRRYYISLLLQAPSQKQGVAVDFLRPRSHRTLISRKILDNTGREIVPVTLPQDDERNLILERFLNKVETHPVIQTPVAPDIDEGNETESSEDEDEEEDFHQGLAFIDLEDAKSYFVSGTPLMQFETEFRDFLHPSRKGVIETQEEKQSQVKKETEQEVNAEPCGWSHNIVYLKNRLSSRLYDTCYPPKLGYQRVWYICECGDRMFLDVKELSPGGTQRFRQRFAKDGLARLLTPSDPMTDQDTTASDHPRSGISAPPPVHLRSERSQSTSSTQSPGPSNSQSEKGPSAPVNDTSGSEEVALPPGQQDTPQFLLLCVNQKTLPVLDHIDCSSFANDQYLFQQILGRYRTIREGSAWRIPLLFPAFVCALVGRVMASVRQKTPSWLEWMFQFFQKLSEASLFEMHTGEYVKFQLVPMGDETTKPHHFRCREYPPELEVQGKRYLYDPVPTDVAIDAIPLWHLTKPGVRHSDNYWITTFPKKLQGPLRRERGTSTRIIGWGIRINERFNWHLFFSLLLVILVVIWAIVAIYLACKADDSSGFGLGALLAAFAAVYVPLQYQAWKEKLD